MIDLVIFIPWNVPLSSKVNELWSTLSAENWLSQSPLVAGVYMYDVLPTAAQDLNVDTLKVGCTKSYILLSTSIRNLYAKWLWSCTHKLICNGANNIPVLTACVIACRNK